ncbi:metal ABC transporter substrate-binding protein, partial [Listeria monocytogenes]|nr:metal ABC transporter substrate-binding protein [Listeria monocytogenes]
MKKAIWLTLVSAGLLLVGCGQQVETRTEDQKEQGETEKVVIGSVGSDAQIWKYIADLDATREAGLTIEVKEIDSGPQLNTATVDGEVDVNAFQSLGYLLSFNQDSETALVPIATTYMEPMGIYSDKYEALSEVP